MEERKFERGECRNACSSRSEVMDERLEAFHDADVCTNETAVITEVYIVHSLTQ